MKKTILYLLLLLVSAAIVNAQNTKDPESDRNDLSSNEFTTDAELNLTDDDLISVAELPHNAKTQLQNQNYVGWTIKNTWRTKNTGKSIYAVELEEGSESWIVTFDARGGLISDSVRPPERRASNAPKHQ